MKTIRNNVFETNSSSMHNVSISNELAVGDYSGTTLFVDASGDYGWSGPLVETPEQKLDYAIVAYLCREYERCPDEDSMSKQQYKAECKKLGEILVKKVTAVLDKIVETFAQYGVTVEFGKNLREYTDGSYYVEIEHSGYIDHQSAPGENSDCAQIANWVETNPNRLFNFCFNNSYIELDNDNH